MAQTAEHPIKVAEILSLMLTEVTFYCWIFLFSGSEACDANITIIATFG